MSKVEKIIVKDGMGRPYKPNEGDGDNVAVWSGPEYPVINPQCDGEFEAELVWQHNKKDIGWTTIGTKQPNNTYLLKNIRQAYRIVNANDCKNDIIHEDIRPQLKPV